MDKYRKVIKPKDTTTPKADEEIRVTAVGSVSAYVSRAAVVYGEKDAKVGGSENVGLGLSKVVIKATGNALTKAVTLAEVIKRRFKGLHQITSLGSTEIVDEYEPIEEGLDKVTQTRNLPFLEITLSKEALDTKDKGYQAPIDESLVKEMDPEELSKPRGRGRGKGRGKGKGKGKGKATSKGKGKGKGKEAPSSKGKGKGKGKGKEAPSSKGKGKGKGKEAPSSKGKGKDKGKGKGKGKEEPKGKSKGKGKDSKGSGKSSKGKGKSSKGYDRYDSYDDWYGYSSKGSKGKGKSKSKSKGWY